MSSFSRLLILSACVLCAACSSTAELQWEASEDLNWNDDQATPLRIHLVLLRDAAEFEATETGYGAADSGISAAKQLPSSFVTYVPLPEDGLASEDQAGIQRRRNGTLDVAPGSEGAFSFPVAEGAVWLGVWGEYDWPKDGAAASQKGLVRIRDLGEHRLRLQKDELFFQRITR